MRHYVIIGFPEHVRSSFIGYAEAEIIEKFKEVKQHGGGPDDWMMKFDDETIRQELERLKMVSEFLREECQRYQLRYIEMSRNFDKSVKDVIEYLG